MKMRAISFTGCSRTDATFWLRCGHECHFVIAPFKYEGMWVFDDPTVGLVREAFVAGMA